MRTTLDIDVKLLEEASRATGARSEREVVELGLRELLSKAARRRLAALHGRIPSAKAPARRRPAPARR